PGPCVTPMASTSCSFRRACPSASRTTGTICRKCSREASSGTTPPYLRCTSSCDATILDRISRPSTTTAAAVSSQEDSMPKMRVFASTTTSLDPSGTRETPRQTPGSAVRFPLSLSRIQICLWLRLFHHITNSRQPRPKGRLRRRLAIDNPIEMRSLLGHFFDRDGPYTRRGIHLHELLGGRIGTGDQHVTQENREGLVTHKI